MPKLFPILAFFPLLILPGCTHLAGTVHDAASRQPFAGAAITIGHPAGLGVFESHLTDARGRFDFYVFPTDENHLYLADPHGDMTNARRLDRSELSDHMNLTLPRSAE